MALSTVLGQLNYTGLTLKVKKIKVYTVWRLFFSPSTGTEDLLACPNGKISINLLFKKGKVTFFFLLDLVFSSNWGRASLATEFKWQLNLQVEVIVEQTRSKWYWRFCPSSEAFRNHLVLVVRGLHSCALHSRSELSSCANAIKPLSLDQVIIGFIWEHLLWPC